MNEEGRLLYWPRALLCPFGSIFIYFLIDIWLPIVWSTDTVSQTQEHKYQNGRTFYQPFAENSTGGMIQIRSQLAVALNNYYMLESTVGEWKCSHNSTLTPTVLKYSHLCNACRQHRDGEKAPQSLPHYLLPFRHGTCLEYFRCILSVILSVLWFNLHLEIIMSQVRQYCLICAVRTGPELPHHHLGIFHERL